MEQCKNFKSGQILCNENKTFVVLTSGYINESCQCYSGTVLFDKTRCYHLGEFLEQISFGICYLYDTDITLKNKLI